MNVVPSLLLLTQCSSAGGHSRMMALSVYVTRIITSDTSVMLPTRLQCVVFAYAHVARGHMCAVCVCVCACAFKDRICMGEIE